MSTTAHVRQHNSILASAEKRALIWMALRLPRWIHSDHLSALGFASMAGAGAAFWLTGQDAVTGALLVVLFLLLNWFGDSLDGTVARPFAIGLAASYLGPVWGVPAGKLAADAVFYALAAGSYELRQYLARARLNSSRG